MGATSYAYFIEGADLDRGFADLRADERARYGSDPYSGTVAAASGGVQQVTSQVCARGEAERLAGQLLEGGYDDYFDLDDADERRGADAAATRAEALVDALGGRSALTGHGYSHYLHRRSERAVDCLPSFMREKNGTAAAIPVGFDHELPIRPHGVPVDLVSLALTEPWAHQAPVEAAIRASVKSARIASVDVLEDTPKWRVVTRRTEGKVVTEYVVYEVAPNGALHPVRDLRPFGSLADARAAADRLVRDTAPRPFGGAPQPLILEVLGRTRRENGHGLVRAERILASRFVVYNVGIVTPATTSPQVCGWWVFGTAGT